MRRKQRRTVDERARRLLKEATVYQLATVNGEGLPVLRTLNGVVVDDWILFHGAIAGEKSQCLGQPAVVAAYEQVAFLPSYFFDKDKATPATTFYESVQGKGVLCDVADARLKAQMLSALMVKYQKEGGYQPLSENSELYRKDLRAVRVFGFWLEEICGKANLGQDKTTEVVSSIAYGLWKRGESGDVEAIEKILEECPDARPERFRFQWRGQDLRLIVAHAPQHIKQHAELLEGQYWREGVPIEEIERSIAGSNAWLAVIDESGELVAAARASTDTMWSAQIMDVVVKKEMRSSGVGSWLMEVLLDHPHVRNCRHQRLGTQDATEFYRKLGFVGAGEIKHSFVSHPMMRVLSRKQENEATLDE